MDKSASRKFTLSHLENFTFLIAMLLAITLEGACVYWVDVVSVTSTPARIYAANLVGRWTTATLPQCWLIGALLVLFYRISAILVPPHKWDQADAQSNQRAFVRLWYWTMALGALQVGAVCMDRFLHGVH
jgi:putative Ca2+/H+ antiporter (TMEM165/GDT1 family)